MLRICIGHFLIEVVFNYTYVLGYDSEYQTSKLSMGH